MDDKHVQMNTYGVAEESDRSQQHGSIERRGKKGGTARDEQEMAYFGKDQQLKVKH